LRKLFIGYLLDSDKDIIIAINQNLGSIIECYGNKHLLENFKGRRAYGDSTSEDEGPSSRGGSTNSAQDISSSAKKQKANK
jgi:hypothetical protein